MKSSSSSPVLVNTKSNSVEEIVTSLSSSPLESKYDFETVGVPVCGSSRDVVKASRSRFETLS